MNSAMTNINFGDEILTRDDHERYEIKMLLIHINRLIPFLFNNRISVYSAEYCKSCLSAVFIFKKLAVLGERHISILTTRNVIVTFL